MVLWKGLELMFVSEVTHKNEPFLITVTAWSRDAELTRAVGVYNPIAMQFIESEGQNTENKKGFDYYYNILKEESSFEG